jgi:hypothetical protein
MKLNVVTSLTNNIQFFSFMKYIGFLINLKGCVLLVSEAAIFSLFCFSLMKGDYIN